MNVILEGKPRTLVVAQADKVRASEVVFRYSAHADQNNDLGSLLAACEAAVDVHFNGTVVDLDSDIDLPEGLHTVKLEPVKNESNQLCLLCSVDAYYQQNIGHELTYTLTDWAHMVTPLIHELDCKFRYEAIIVRADGSVHGMSGHANADIGCVAIVDPSFKDIELPRFNKFILPVTGDNASTLLSVLGKVTITYNRCFYRGD